MWLPVSSSHLFGNGCHGSCRYFLLSQVYEQTKSRSVTQGTFLKSAKSHIDMTFRISFTCQIHHIPIPQDFLVGLVGLLEVFGFHMLHSCLCERHVAASECSYAAVLMDGSLVTWGSSHFGGDSQAVQDCAGETGCANG